ncbi:MAG: hypothetical protein WC205_03275 [Opitutaceae bacterium]|jgi:hypothetical protein
MKPQPLLIAVFLVFCSGALAVGKSASIANTLVVHEWGTFTSVHASDGTLLTGLEREEHRLPGFVKSHAGFAPANKGWDRPVKNVTIKMETPVIYFYADRETSVTVDVGFNGGSISQWYPQRSGGEELAPLPQPLTDIEQWRGMVPVDFAKTFTGSIQWRATVLSPDSTEKITALADWETPQWPRARVEEANRVRTPDGSVEGFLFYRGIGNFELPLRISVDAQDRLILVAKPGADIPSVLVYDNRRGVANYEWSGLLAGGETKALAPVRVHTGPLSGELLMEPLMEAGLTEGEAHAMLATWKESYFDTPGLRVFWVIPRTFTDAILPIKVTPVPDKMERVLVGRSEVLTPVFERLLFEGFMADGGKAWVNDRYFSAYRARVKHLGVVLPANTP